MFQLWLPKSQGATRGLWAQVAHVVPLRANSAKFLNSAIFMSNRWYRATDNFKLYLKWHLKKKKKNTEFRIVACYPEFWLCNPLGSQRGWHFITACPWLHKDLNIDVPHMISSYHTCAVQLWQNLEADFEPCTDMQWLPRQQIMVLACMQNSQGVA